MGRWMIIRALFIEFQEVVRGPCCAGHQGMIRALFEEYSGICQTILLHSSSEDGQEIVQSGVMGCKEVLIHGSPWDFQRLF